MDRLPSHPTFFQFFSPKRDQGTLQPLRSDINWLRHLPRGAAIAARHSLALDAAIARLIDACAAARAAAPGDAQWMAAFVSACDDLQVPRARCCICQCVVSDDAAKVIDKRVPMHTDAPKHRCNEVFQALQHVLFHPSSSDLVVEQAFTALNLLLPPPQHTDIPRETDWKPFYRLFRQCICSKISYRTLAPCPFSLAVLASRSMQTISNYFSPSSASEILFELRSAMRMGHFVDAGILTTFLPPTPGCMASALPVIFDLWDVTLDPRIPLQERKALDLCCISTLAYIAHITLFPVATNESSESEISTTPLDFNNWSPYVSCIFSHAARILCTLNDGNLLYTPPLSDVDNVPDTNVLIDLSNLIMCLMFISPDDVSHMLKSLYVSVEHLLNPLASTDAAKVRNAVLLVWWTSYWFIELMARYDLIPLTFQRVKHDHVEWFVLQLLPTLLALLPMSPLVASRCLRRLYLFRPDIVAPAITANIRLILQRSVDCPDAFDCIPTVFREFNAALFVPLHRAIDSLIQKHVDDPHISACLGHQTSKEPTISEMISEIKRVHGMTAELSQHTRQTSSDVDSFAFMELLPEIAETLLTRVDPGVESSAAALEFFHFLWSNMPCIPLPSVLAPTTIGLSPAALKSVTRINSFFVRPHAPSSLSFCARFFAQILVFLDRADQPESWSVDGDTHIGPKSEAKRERESWFQPCIERFVMHLPLRDHAVGLDYTGVFTFDDAVEQLLKFCSLNTALQLPVHTYTCVCACMAAHDHITARIFMPFLMQQLLRPAAAASPVAVSDSPLPVRHNRVLSTRNERILRYFAGILDTILSSVRTNACRTFIMEFVPQIYDLDKFLLATRHSTAAKKPRDSNSKQKKKNRRTRARSSSHEPRDGDEVLNLAMEFEALSTSKKMDKGGRKHKVKHLFSDGCDLVASLLRCFTMTTVVEMMAVPPNMWNSGWWQHIHFVSWGRPVTVEGIDALFDIPTDEHLRCASAIFRKFAIEPLHALVNIMNGASAPEDDLDEFKFLQREISIITSCVRASRMFISPFPDSSSSPRPPALSLPGSSPKSFGTWFIPSPTNAISSSVPSPSPRPDSMSESSQFDWDNVLSRCDSSKKHGQFPSLSTPDEFSPSVSARDLGQILFKAYAGDYNTERPVASNCQAYTLPGVSLQQLVSALNAFLSWMQSAHSRDGLTYSDIPSLSLAILSLYEAVFGFGPANFAIPTKKPAAPGHHITSITHDDVFKREDLLADLEFYWLQCHQAVCWLPCLANDVAANLLLPAIKLILPFALHASDDVQSQAQTTLASVVSRTGPCGVAQVACSTLERLADPCLADNDVPGLMKLLQKLVPIYKDDWTLSVALSTRLLESRTRSHIKAEAIKCIDDMWRTNFTCARWAPASSPPRISSDCLAPSSLATKLNQNPCAASPSVLQDIVISVMLAEWPQLHSKYQQRCLAMLTEFTSKDAPLSVEHWEFLWKLFPLSVGIGDHGHSLAKNCGAYTQMLSMFEVALNALSIFSETIGSLYISSSSTLTLPLVNSDGTIRSTSLPDESCLSVVNGFIKLLGDDSYTSSFVLAAAAAFEGGSAHEDFKQRVDTVPLRSQRISLFRSCTQVFGAPFLSKVCLPYFHALNGNPSRRFPFKSDQESIDSYMYLSNDMMVGCMLGALSLPQELQSQVISSMLPNVRTLVLSTEAMPPTYRNYLAQAFGYFCEKALGTLLKESSLDSPASSSITPLEPFFEVIFAPVASQSSDPTYLSKRMQLRAHAPTYCEPFIRAVSSVGSHPSDVVRTALAELLSALTACCTTNATSSLSQMALSTSSKCNLIPWVSSFFTSYVSSLLEFFSPASELKNSITSSDLTHLKSTLASCSFAHLSMIPFIPEIVSILLAMFEDSQSLSVATATSTIESSPGRLLCAISDLPLPETALAAVIDSVSTRINHQSRHVRIASASFCCLLSSNMMTTLSKQQHLDLLNAPLLLLGDPHPDVRTSAQTALSRMLRAPQLMSQISQLVQKFQDMATSGDLHKSSCGIVGGELLNNLAGVAGLSAIILSRPFDIPQWLIPVINVAIQFVDAPSQISKIVVAAFDSFWRSHHYHSMDVFTIDALPFIHFVSIGHLTERVSKNAIP